MQDAIIAGALAGALMLLVGLQGCSPGTKVWIYKGAASPSLSSPQSGAGASRRSGPPLADELTENDRQELNRLLAKIGGK